jgi:cell division protein ZapA (FtsZ GTPase activity inhibitor)
MKRKVDVTLLGERFSVRSDKDEGHLHALAAQVSRRFEELRRHAKSATTQQLAILLALNLADELSQAEERAAHTREAARAATEGLLHKLTAALAAVDAEGDDDVEEAHDNDVALVLHVDRI